MIANFFSFKLVRYLPILVFVLFIGCQTNENELTTFPEPHPLQGQPLEDITLYSKGNTYLTVADTFLVIQSGQAPFIHIYSTNTHKKLAEFGTEGKGPGEYIGPSLLSQTSFDSTNNSPVVHVFDFKQQTLTRINILEAINEGSTGERIKLPTERFLTFFYFINDDFYLAAPPSGGRFLIHNFQTSQDTLIPYIPETDFSIDDMMKSMVYRSAAVVNTKRNLIASAPLYFGELNFFDLNGNLLHSTKWQPRDAFEEEISSGMGALDKTQMHIVDMDVANGLIYGLNRNASVTENSNHKRQQNMKVQVFRWDGEPIRQYMLDERRITYFAIDPKHNRIYGYSPDEMEHNVIAYPLQKNNQE